MTGGQWRVIILTQRKEKNMLEATINFQNRDQANDFATAWAFKSKMGHTISGSSVSVYNVTEELKAWIDSYVTQINEFINHDSEFDDLSDDELLKELFD